ncbi:hypothetical protein [Actinomadura formosensis]|uniref:hypothetical protein n=1 Tax=Actinomadura formosensis TaxID=60706 RepID=UPI003D91F7AD
MKDLTARLRWRRSYAAYARGMYVGRFRMSRRVARRQRKVGWILLEVDPMGGRP